MNLLLLVTEDETKYLPMMKPIIGSGHSTSVVTKKALTLIEVLIYCKQRQITGVITTQAQLISKLTGENYSKEPSLSDYAGSLLSRDGIDFVFINPLESMYTLSYGKFLMSRYISKLTKPNNWWKATEFSWEVATPASLDSLLTRFKTALLIASDIETIETNLTITCVGFTGVFTDSNNNGALITHTVVIPATSEFYVSWIGKFNSLPAPKVYQNGKYDLSYLCRYNLPVTNWRFDTAVAMHCWYSELPKDLAFLNAFLVRECRYWKHEAHVGFTSEQYYLYNAHDCHNTANAMMAWLVEAPQWAKDNYIIEFPLLFPCHLAEMTGIKMDNQRRVDVKHHWDKLIESANSNLSRSLGVANFNVNSPKQVGILKLLLGCEDIKSGDEKSLAKASTRHPLNELLFNQVLAIRGYRKLVSTYLKDTGMALEGITNGTGNGIQRILFSLNPYNTDTGRLASKEHSFWLGVNIQNQPSKSEDRIKEMYLADKDFLFGEADYEQAESRGTGYISGDTNLINATESKLDFHTINASKFFGIPYNEITNPDTGKTINKPIRDLSKRTNHGANYNMGAQMMLDTMGEINVIKAKGLLQLPHYFTPLQVCEYLLEQFGKTYPVVRFDYQAWIKNTIKVASKLVSAYGWTRWCFGKPDINKQDLNSLIAHCPQNLNAGMLNEAWLRVFIEIWLVYPNDFKLCAQIHDSILFQYRIGCEFLIDMVANCMRNPVVVTDISGLKRVLIVPVAIKSGGVRWSDCS